MVETFSLKWTVNMFYLSIYVYSGYKFISSARPLDDAQYRYLDSYIIVRYHSLWARGVSPEGY